MGFILMFVLAFAWGLLSGIFIENKLVAIIVSGVGGYLIGVAFQHFNLIGV